MTIIKHEPLTEEQEKELGLLVGQVQLLMEEIDNWSAAKQLTAVIHKLYEWTASMCRQHEIAHDREFENQRVAEQIKITKRHLDAELQNITRNREWRREAEERRKKNQ